MKQIRPPLLAIDGFDIRAFSSIKSALVNTEPLDVEDPQCQLYDADGCRVILGVERVQTPFLWGLFTSSIEQVVVCDVVSSPSDRETLRNALIGYLVVVTNRPPELFEGCSLEEVAKEVLPMLTLS